MKIISRKLHCTFDNLLSWAIVDQMKHSVHCLRHFHSNPSFLILVSSTFGKKKCNPFNKERMLWFLFHFLSLGFFFGSFHFFCRRFFIDERYKKGISSFHSRWHALVFSVDFFHRLLFHKYVFSSFLLEFQSVYTRFFTFHNL